MLAGTPFDVQSLDSYPDIIEVEETGLTFIDNAQLKASGYARQTGLLSLADDSGLEVASLGGRPGVLSARYGGEGTSFADKMAMLIAELDAAGGNDRRARFVCAMAVADADGNILFTSKGICPGNLGTAPRGTGGFGYDPLFVPDGSENTFGELPDAVKREISHRARAFSEIIPFLRHFIAI